MKGIWAETGIEVAPEFLGGESTFGKFYFTWRQYFTLKERDLSFAYRLGYQTDPLRRCAVLLPGTGHCV